MSIVIMEIPYNSGQYRKVLDLRRKVLREPLGLDFMPQQLADEKNDTHLAAYAGDSVIAAVVLTPQDETKAKLRQMVVGPECQGQGIGAQLLAYAEDVLRARGYVRIILHARMTAADFYRKHGYEPVGDSFMEVTVPHLRMEKHIAG